MYCLAVLMSEFHIPQNAENGGECWHVVLEQERVQLQVLRLQVVEERCSSVIFSTLPIALSLTSLIGIFQHRQVGCSHNCRPSTYESEGAEGY